MALRQVPRALPRRLVVVEPQTNAVPDFAQGLGELQVDRGVVHRVAAENEQRLDLPGVHVGNQRGNRLHVGGAVRLRIGRAADRRSHVAQRRVDLVDQGVDFRRLARPDDHSAPRPIGLEVLGHGLKEREGG